MKTIYLTLPALERSRRFVETRGRPLDAARLRFHFDAAPPAEVTRELARFANPDGGFGHALEPDLRAPESSALATTVALQILREVGGGDPDGLASRAVAHLVRACDRETLSWRIVPASAEAHPHAPWWSRDHVEAGLGRFALNPGAEILGYLCDHRTIVPPEMLAALSEQVAECLAAATAIEMHDFLCCKRLTETERLDAGFRQTVVQHLARLLDTAVARDASRWAQYGLPPLQAADHPGSPFHAALRDEVQRNLDYEIEMQLDDGSWPVTWSWSGAYPDAWPRAALDWTSAFIVMKLLTLKRFGRIEGSA